MLRNKYWIQNNQNGGNFFVLIQEITKRSEYLHISVTFHGQWHQTALLENQPGNTRFNTTELFKVVACSSRVVKFLIAYKNEEPYCQI